MSCFHWTSPLHMFQTVHDCSVQCVKSLLRNKKELSSVDLELPPRLSRRLTEVGHTKKQINHIGSIGANIYGLFQIHYVCLPCLAEEDDIDQQVSLIHVHVLSVTEVNTALEKI